MHQNGMHWIRVRGDFACFSQPEFPRERVSYRVIPPSAAAGLFYSVLSKPAISWHVRKILLLSEPQITQIRRAELGDIPTPHNNNFFAGNHRQLRNSVILKDVDYAIGATLHLTDYVRPEDKGNHQKFSDMFSRRLAKGQIWSSPYLGLREFIAEIEPYSGSPKPLNYHSYELGRMPLSVPFDQSPPQAPLFFEARLVRGEIDVPDVDLFRKEHP